ncbi:exported protein of unknown function [Georgfuchsia toluolica]|uniref:Uncharacterized protein n=1 Tax=Georgfuchsia toluolica TaxID=424218 RepID=A0A916J5G7_9PROT|nr:exported protein of unknown function [Georgfuchsia toluolica]
MHWNAVLALAIATFVVMMTGPACAADPYMFNEDDMLVSVPLSVATARYAHCRDGRSRFCAPCFAG